jgi:hypothetical protein
LRVLERRVAIKAGKSRSLVAVNVL